ncbi:membrane hypothetical protein [Gammaproteobacteria bacterium]
MDKISMLVSLEGDDQGLKDAVESANASFEKLKTEGQVAGEQISLGLSRAYESLKSVTTSVEGASHLFATFHDKGKASAAGIEAGLASLNSAVEKTKNLIIALVGIDLSFAGLKAAVGASDDFARLDSSIKQVVSTEKEFDTAQKAIQVTAQALGEPLKTVASLYLDLQKGINKLGGTQAEAIQLTGTLSKAFHLSGETAAEAKTQTDAFAKMLLTGSISAVQFNTMLDKSPALAKALADGLGVTTFALKDMATNGELSAAKLTQALLSQKDAVEKGYSQIPLLIGEAFDRVTNRIKNAVGVWLNELASYVLQLAQSSGATDAFSKAIDVLGEHLDTVKTTLKVLAEVGLGALILTSIPAMLMGLGSLGTALAAVGTAITAAFAMLTTSATVAVLALGPVSVAFLALAALVAGWQFGTWLTEQFVAVKVAGILAVGVLLLGFEQLRYGWELFQAVFTKDKFSEVAKEHAKRLAEIKESMTVLTQEAVNASKGMTSAMGSAGEAAAAIAKQIEGVKNALKESVTSSIKEIGSVAQKAQTEIEAQDKAIRGLERTIKESLSSIQAVYKMQTEAVKKEYDDQKVSVKSLYDYQKGQLEAYTSNKIALIKTESALLLNMVDTEVAARKKATEETLRLLGEEIQNVKNATDRENIEDDRRNIHAVETELKILNNQREKLTEALQSYRSHIDALNAEINRHYAAAAAAEDAKRDPGNRVKLSLTCRRKTYHF